MIVQVRNDGRLWVLGEMVDCCDCYHANGFAHDGVGYVLCVPDSQGPNPVGPVFEYALDPDGPPVFKVIDSLPAWTHQYPTETEKDGTAEVARITVAEIVRTRPHSPCPPNLFLVSAYGEHLLMVRKAHGRLTKPEALNLAVWLVALADPQYTTFRAILDAILER
jgi:hypothetical protein